MGNWPTVTTGGEPIDMRAWCNGSPGIALSRIALMKFETARVDLDRACASLASSAFHPVDHVCCGNSGRVEALATAGRMLDRADLVEQARGRAAAMLHRVAKERSWRLRLRPSANRIPRPGFFKGSSGVAWTLLRLASPDLLPCVAGFEPVTESERTQREIA